MSDTLTASEQRKVDALTNTFGETFKKMPDGTLAAAFGGMSCGAITNRLQKLGLEEGRDFKVTDPRAGEISIQLAALPDPGDARPNDYVTSPAAAHGYGFALEQALGIKVQPDIAYSADKNHPFDNILVVETGSKQYADVLSERLAQVRHEMGIPQKDMPIAYFEGTAFALSVGDIANYDQMHGGNGAFTQSLNTTLQKTDIDDGETYRQKIDRVVSHIKEESPELVPQKSSSAVPYNSGQSAGASRGF